jgi:hypothetical protein
MGKGRRKGRTRKEEMKREGNGENKRIRGRGSVKGKSNGKAKGRRKMEESERPGRSKRKLNHKRGIRRRKNLRVVRARRERGGRSLR